jgi:hypothetical protein
MVVLCCAATCCRQRVWQFLNRMVIPPAEGGGFRMHDGEQLRLHTHSTPANTCTHSCSICLHTMETGTPAQYGWCVCVAVARHASPVSESPQVTTELRVITEMNTAVCVQVVRAMCAAATPPWLLLRALGWTHGGWLPAPAWSTTSGAVRCGCGSALDWVGVALGIRAWCCLGWMLEGLDARASMVDYIRRCQVCVWVHPRCTCMLTSHRA